MKLILLLFNDEMTAVAVTTDSFSELPTDKFSSDTFLIEAIVGLFEQFNIVDEVDGAVAFKVREELYQDEIIVSCKLKHLPEQLSWKDVNSYTVPSPIWFLLEEAIDRMKTEGENNA